MDLADLKAKTPPELLELAREFEVSAPEAMRHQDLIYAILRAHTERRGVINAVGVLEILADGFGFLRSADCNYLPGADDIYVSPSQIRRFDLRTGDTVTGQIRAPKESERYFALLKVESINHGSPDAHKNKPSFDELTAVHPCEALTLEHDPTCLMTRAIDLVSPLGKGQRCLLAGPSHSGQLAAIEAIARAIEANHSDVELLVVLIDVGPEDVTSMRRALGAQIVASSFDEPAARHTQIADIVIDKARRLAENGADVVLLLDSLSRLTRAYNATASSTTATQGRVFEGGVDPSALHKSKRLFGAARKLEEGGSLTIVATVLTGTGSRTDEVIFEELCHAANCEIHLDGGRDAAVSIDPGRSCTRNQELLRDSESCEKARKVCDELATSGDLGHKLSLVPTNSELL